MQHDDIGLLFEQSLQEVVGFKFADALVIPIDCLSPNKEYIVSIAFPFEIPGEYRAKVTQPIDSRGQRGRYVYNPFQSNIFNDLPAFVKSADQ